MADLLAQKEALDVVARRLAGYVPDGADSVTLRVSALRAVSHETLVANLPGGDIESLPGADWELADAVRDLRDVMYEPGAGTWFSAVFTVTADGRMASTFDYDNEPDWDVGPAAPSAYAADLEYYPRDEGNVPEWLTRILAH